MCGRHQLSIKFCLQFGTVSNNHVSTPGFIILQAALDAGSTSPELTVTLETK